MSAISTHVLDTSQGRPAGGVPVTLEISSARDGGAHTWEPHGGGETDADGRVRDLLPAGAALAAATYRLTFDTGAYFSAHGVEASTPRSRSSFRYATPRSTTTSRSCSAPTATRPTAEAETIAECGFRIAD